MIQELLYDIPENKQPVFTNPPLKIKENRQAVLFSNTGIAAMRDFIRKQNMAAVIDKNVSVLKRHLPYFESDHVLNFVYNFLTGGENLIDIEQLQNDKAFLNVIGAESIPDPTTAGDFLNRFDSRDTEDLQKALDTIQDNHFASVINTKNEKFPCATIDFDSSIHKVYGRKKQGADFAYDNTWSYNALYITLAETGDTLFTELRSGNTYTSTGITERLPGIITRVQNYFKQTRARGDSGYYDHKIVKICDDSDTEFFITAVQTGKLLKNVVSIEEDRWKSFRPGNSNKLYKKRKKRRKRRNEKRRIALKRLPDKKYKGNIQISSFTYKPQNWEKEYRYIVKRTEIVDKSGQLLLEDNMVKYQYHIIVTNSKRSDTEAMKIAQGRGNHENYIKDFKYGLGLSHIPTGFLNANNIYFKIAALAWNIKTWFLNLINPGSGAVIRFKRFLCQWIKKASVVSRTGRNTIVIRMEAGEYFNRFGKAISLINA